MSALPLSPVNGPEDASMLWHQIDWSRCEGEVRRLRQRIFKAAQEEDWPKVRNLQKLMLRSYSNTLVSVRRVSQLSTGRKTAKRRQGEGGNAQGSVESHVRGPSGREALASHAGQAGVHPEE